MGKSYPNSSEKDPKSPPPARYLADPNQYNEHFDTVTTSAATDQDGINEVTLQPGDIVAINWGNGHGHNLIVGDDGKIYGASTYGIACYDSLQDLYDHYGLQNYDWAI